MTKKERSCLYDVRERVIRIEDKVTVQNGRLAKAEKKLEHIEPMILKYGIWDKIKSGMLYCLWAYTGSVTTYVFVKLV